MEDLDFIEYSDKRKRFSNCIKLFHFPRLAGTEGEKKAVELAVDSFNKIGYKKEDILQEQFPFSTFYSAGILKIIIIMNMTLVLILLFLSYLRRIVVFGIIFIIFIVSIALLKDIRHPEFFRWWERNLGKIRTGTNVIATVPANLLTKEKAGDIIISAHLDTKSQTFRTRWRIALFSSWIIVETLLIFSHFTSNLFLDVIPEDHKVIIFFFELFIYVLSALVLLINVFLLFFRTRNDSPGALDNASGMSIVFELSSIFIKKPLDNFNLWFCQFSAEEQGTMGSRNFLNRREGKFTRGKTFQINFDMVSLLEEPKYNIEYVKSYGFFPKKKIAPLLSHYLKTAANEKKIKIHGFNVTVGAHTDSIPFHLRKFGVIDITTRAATRYTHSKEDTWERVDPQILIQTFSIVKRMILMLDRDFYILKEKKDELKIN